MYAEMYNDCRTLIGKFDERISAGMLAVLLETEIKLAKVKQHNFEICTGNLEEIREVYSCMNAEVLCNLILQLQEIELRIEKGCDKKNEECSCTDYINCGICSHICKCCYAEYICDPYIEELSEAIETQVCHLVSSICGVLDKHSYNKI